MHRLTLVIIALGLALIIADCASPAPTPTPHPTGVPTAVPPTPTPAPVPPTQPPAQPTQPPAAVAQTAGELATLGVAVYKASCGRCHDGGFASPLSNGLRDFRNAQELFRFMQTKMPQDAPGTLEPEAYFQVLAGILVDGKIVAADAVLDINKLAEIIFK